MGSVVHLAKRLKDGDEERYCAHECARPRQCAAIALYAGVR